MWCSISASDGLGLLGGFHIFGFDPNLLSFYVGDLQF